MTLRTFAILILTLSAFPSAEQTARKTVWDGVYTEEQATRGERAYQRRCAKCHLEDLGGNGAPGAAPGEFAPALVGASFSERWNERTVGEIFATIGRAMPQDAPGTLRPQANADIVSFLLKMNAFPSGGTELPAETEKLEQIVVTVDPPAK